MEMQFARKLQPVITFLGSNMAPALSWEPYALQQPPPALLSWSWTDLTSLPCLACKLDIIASLWTNWPVNWSLCQKRDCYALQQPPPAQLVWADLTLLPDWPVNCQIHLKGWFVMHCISRTYFTFLPAWSDLAAYLKSFLAWRDLPVDLKLKAIHLDTQKGPWKKHHMFHLFPFNALCWEFLIRRTQDSKSDPLIFRRRKKFLSCSSWCRASPGRRCRRPPSWGHSPPPSLRELRCLPVSALTMDL